MIHLLHFKINSKPPNEHPAPGLKAALARTPGFHRICVLAPQPSRGRSQGGRECARAPRVRRRSQSRPPREPRPHPPAPQPPLLRRRADSSGRVAAMSGALDVLWEDRDVRFDISPQWVPVSPPGPALTAALSGPPGADKRLAERGLRHLRPTTVPGAVHGGSAAACAGSAPLWRRRKSASPAGRDGQCVLGGVHCRFQSIKIKQKVGCWRAEGRVCAPPGWAFSSPEKYNQAEGGTHGYQDLVPLPWSWLPPQDGAVDVQYSTEFVC